MDPTSCHSRPLISSDKISTVIREDIHSVTQVSHEDAIAFYDKY